MAPATESDEGERPKIEERALQWASKHTPWVFRSDSLRRFKAKYADAWEPRYEIYSSRADLPRLALALLDVLKVERTA